jgi:hypothetical protein
VNLSLLLNELNEFTSIPTLEKSNEVDHTQSSNINSTKSFVNKSVCSPPAVYLHFR